MTSLDFHAQVSGMLNAHFGGRIDPDGETALRAHLPGCAPCRRRYDRHLLFARLDPASLPAIERLARGLDLKARARALPRRLGLLLAVPVLALAALSFWLAPRQDAATTFSARGAGGAPPALWIYRVAQGGLPRSVDASVRADDELAFAYSNPAGARFVMVFAVDEHRHVYWFHPGWEAGAAPPRAVAAQAGPGPHELPAAIRHALDGRRLVVYGWFSEEPAGVAAVERAARAAAQPDALVAPPGTQLVRRELQVGP